MLVLSDSLFYTKQMISLVKTQNKYKKIFNLYLKLVPLALECLHNSDNFFRQNRHPQNYGIS